MRKLVTVLEGAGGIKQVYERSLNSISLDFVCTSQNYEKVIGEYYSGEYAPTLFGKTTKTREILPDNRENRDYGKLKDGEKNNVRYIQATPSETDIILADDFVALISFNPNSPMAVVIEEEELMKMLRRQFETVYEMASD